VKIEPLRNKLSQAVITPGPGEYNTIRAEALTRSKSASVIIKPEKNSRKLAVIESAIGPGTY
jgi:hypothetical protein